MEEAAPRPAGKDDFDNNDDLDQVSEELSLSVKPVNKVVKVSGRLRSDHAALEKEIRKLNDKGYRVVQVLRIDESKNYVVIGEQTD